MEYRQATFDEVEQIHKLCNYYAMEGLMLPRSRNSIYENLRDYIVAMDGGHLVGCGALHFVWERLAEVRSLAVEPALTRGGIGREIVKMLEQDGIAKGAKMFFTLTYQPEFFSACGFTETERESLPQKVWKECIHCSQYPYCNERAYVKVLPGYEKPESGIV